MKFASLKNKKTGFTDIGVVFGNDRVVSLRELARALQIPESELPTDMLGFIESGNPLLDQLRAGVEQLDVSQLNGIPEAELEWMPPVRAPKILGCTINNAAVAKLASVVPETPNFFVKPSSCLIGHKQPIVIRPDYGLTHPEAELAVVIGKRVKDISPEEVDDAIFGFTIMNDITSIGLKSEDTFVFPKPDIEPAPPGFEHGDMQLVYHARSKGTDTFGPCGPWIVTKDDIENANALGVYVSMAGEECTEDNTANLRYTYQEVISWASKYFTLEPGDLIHIGTAAGGRYGLRELNFQAWDGPCAVTIEGIGVLSNPVERVDIAGNPVEAQPKQTSAQWPPRYKAG